MSPPAKKPTKRARPLAKKSGASKSSRVPAAKDTALAPASKTLPKLATNKARNITEAERMASVRWQTVHILLNNAVGTSVSLTDLAKMLHKYLPDQDEPYDKSTMTRLAKGRRRLTLNDILALSHVCNRYGMDVDPGWVAFGDKSKAPEPVSRLLSNSHRLPDLASHRR